MHVEFIDWIIIISFFILSLGIGLYASKQAGKSSSEFFLSGRNMPWWLLGVSMVATTFSTDTPNLVTDIVRKNGVAGNWVWWAFLLTGMLTVFVYAKLWRRSGVMTDLEFYEMRYSGKPAAFLRGFRAIYLGVIFNIVVMATVCLAAIKIGGVMFALSPIQSLLAASVITVLYSSTGGLRGIVLTDFFQFLVAMIGTIVAAIYIVNIPEVGGLTKLLSHPAVQDKLAMVPSLDNRELFYMVFLIPIAVQWWASYYPGAEPGGGGYVAQRMLAAKNESHAVKATFLFNIMHYALRPWPWILVALASMIVFPDLASIKAKFPHIADNVINDDLAYPAMMTLLPAGLLGIIVTALIAGFMSTISTHLNWGSSYMVNDVYRRFIDNDADEKTLVRIGRIFTVVLMVLAATLALFLQNALQAFNIILLIGAGTGLLFILRWFWWRINAYCEITAMVVSFIIAVYFQFFYEGNMNDYEKMLSSIFITTVAWVAVAFLSRPTDNQILVDFYKKIKPFPLGWRHVLDQNKMTPAKASLKIEITAMILGCTIVYASLFGTGWLLYGQMLNALIAFAIAIMAAFGMKKIWPKISFE